MLEPKDERSSPASPSPAAVCAEMAMERKTIFLLCEVENSPNWKEVTESGPKVHLGGSQAQFS